MFIGKYNKSVILTYVGVTVSIVGIALAINRNTNFAMLCLIVAGICDLFDGAVARMMKRTEEEKSFGVQIDSLADMVGFVALPITIFYSMGLNSIYHTGLYALYALCAITRLGYFNISVAGVMTEEPIKYYSGLPVTYAALIFPLVWLVSFVSAGNIFTIVFTVAIALVALLFVLNIKIPKPRGAAYIFFLALALGMSSFIIYRGLN
ncbi:MAG: phosphatidylcholine/phosphatidylserine synthase [Clostridiales bacterium]|nr:phosphatidylcholine/phosphatidylserine synthase [Clostridiales bacterium]